MVPDPPFADPPPPPFLGSSRLDPCPPYAGLDPGPPYADPEPLTFGLVLEDLLATCEFGVLFLRWSEDPRGCAGALLLDGLPLLPVVVVVAFAVDPELS